METQNRAAECLDHLPAGPLYPAEFGDKGAEPGAVAGTGRPGQAGLDQTTAVRACGAVRNQMGDIHLDLGKLDHLMGVKRRRLLAGQAAAAGAGARPQILNMGGFQKLPLVPLVALLPALFVFGLFLRGRLGFRFRRVEQRIGRRRLVGIPGILPEAGFKLVNAFFEPGDKLGMMNDRLFVLLKAVANGFGGGQPIGFGEGAL